MLTINNTLDGYLKDVEIKGNTIQDSENLADIRSVGDKVEGQELYEIPVLSHGKNLFDGEFKEGKYEISDGSFVLQPKISANVNTILINENTNYSISRPTLADGINTRVLFYDKNMKYLSSELVVGNASFMTPVNTKYINFHIATSVFDDKLPFQLEEGTQATPYEPYVEDKLTILSPVQLEKVGDVRDRIIEKDGVWGVEKNVETVVLNGNISWNKDAFDSTNCNSFWATNIYDNLIGFGTNRDVISCISPHIQGVTRSTYEVCDFSCISLNANGRGITIKVPNTIKTSAELNDYLISINMNLKVGTTNPQFIPLPHSQQIKLRTFANKTNISFLTEIEGTIKAQVPKSLGATVNTHTEQIRSLNNELNRVKKLEESTVSTVTTESDFTTVEATSNGYFEDVKLEGKTLVNLIPKDIVGISDVNYSKPFFLDSFKLNQEYTLIVFGINLLENTTMAISSEGGGANSFVWNIPKEKGRNLFKFKSLNSDFDFGRNVRIRLFNEILNPDVKFIILEGDHTQNPPSYFEGLKSVGQSATTSEDGADEIVVSSVNSDDTKSDKKRLLYYNEETQTWEKPILREWDSIEKHANGKYYYHQRSGEVVLNGSESWRLVDNSELDNTLCFAYPESKCTTVFNKNIIFDKFTVDTASYVTSTDIERGTIFATSRIAIRILKSKLSTQDAQGFKQWLQANNVTVVYQLAEEKVYECTNIDLITYANETNYIINCGAIVPKTTLKVHNNISNVVSLLQKKVSLLESNITSYMITQNRLQLASTYSADSVTFKVDYFAERSVTSYDNDLFNLILNNIIVGKENYDYDKMFNIIMDYASWSQISWDQFDILVGMMDLQHNPPIELPTEEFPEETPEE